MNDPLIGSQVAGYRVERLLGRGGMASVYMAWDGNNDRPVALKVLDERLGGEQSAINRFVQEAQAIASWEHPHIVRVYDAGESQGIYYYAMEFIRGLDLAQLLRQYSDAGQLLPFEEVDRIGWAVAEALDFAHSRGIVHRDIKPSNVLVSVDSRILLTDFGLVMDMARGTLGETFGSPHYIAPEQARRSSEAVPQSDLYALAVMLYEMLTGVVPFHDPSPAALALKHLTEEPPTPRSLNPRLSPGVEAVLLRGLRKTPRERYATGRELMTALERALGSELTQPNAGAPLPAPSETQQARAIQASGAPFPPPAPVPNPGSTAVRPAAGYGANSPPSVNRPAGTYTGYTQGGYPPGQPPPSYTNRGQASAYPAPEPQRRRSSAAGFTCLALVLAGLGLAAVLGAGFAMSGGAFRLPNLGVFAPAPTETPRPGEPTATLTDTPVPTLTETPTLQPTETPTPEPTVTETPTLAPSPTLEPTLPPAPIPTPVPPLAIYHYKDQGIIVVNQGETPIPLPLIELWDNDPELAGGEWGVEFLEPGQCVFAWERDGRVRMPADLDCEPVGELAERQGGQKFWTHTILIRYEGEEIAECRADEEKCEIVLPE